MQLVEVQPVAPQPVDRPEQLLAGPGPVPHLRLAADEDVRPRVALEVVAEPQLRLGVARGDVDVVDATVQGRLDQHVGLILRQDARGVGPERDDGAGMAGRAEWSGLHGVPPYEMDDDEGWRTTHAGGLPLPSVHPMKRLPFHTDVSLPSGRPATRARARVTRFSAVRSRPPCRRLNLAPI
ncbi:MAG: hypothetical protein AVDCRST_MAG24-747 [uncultured Nocardioidaceae bacterium]|uniref:Uncharacterized protein n=1 Tax=uncultured Nocardioidaceae bacterium TaxID=253824 RepID=A0A6J4LG40_9ACTN|nr:MAG: hypothetical protein AVDCRST_MAG24-747 [uncultured Nocardioidaceae bacterium]